MSCGSCQQWQVAFEEDQKYKACVIDFMAPITDVMVVSTNPHNYSQHFWWWLYSQHNNEWEYSTIKWWGVSLQPMMMGVYRQHEATCVVVYLSTLIGCFMYIYIWITEALDWNSSTRCHPFSSTRIGACPSSSPGGIGACVWSRSIAFMSQNGLQPQLWLCSNIWLSNMFQRQTMKKNGIEWSKNGVDKSLSVWTMFMLSAGFRHLSWSRRVASSWKKSWCCQPLEAGDGWA